jgi:transcriptional regulator with XRE-family HTH domain
VKRARETTEGVQRDVGLRIAELREEREASVAQFAVHLGVSERYVQRVEAGGANLTLDSLVKFATALGVRVADLFVLPTKRERAAGRPVGRREERPRRRAAGNRGRR